MKVLASAFLITLLTVPAAAQRFEVYGGYSAERIAPCGTSTTFALGTSCGLELGELTSSNNFINGWNAALTAYGHRILGFTADFATHYHTFDSPTRTRYSFLFGPTVALPLPKIKPFAHVLFGAVKETDSSGGIDSFTEPDILVGGGLDFKMSHHFSVRLAQVEYEWQKNPTSGLSNPNGLRLGAGIVFKF